MESSHSLCAVLEEQRYKKTTAPVPVFGPELAALMKVGTRVARGVDWKWGDQVWYSFKVTVLQMLKS